MTIISPILIQVARAIASQCQLHFISIQGPELLNSFVGQSEKNVRDIFEEARAMAPTVLFFDEIDAVSRNCLRVKYFSLREG